jgi:serine/threonine protein kinase
MATLKSKNIKLDLGEFIDLSIQLASGCEHVASKGLVHMDVACRNILVADNNVIKLADFGLTHAMGENGVVELTEQIRVPVKWSAPEAVFNMTFSEKSDIWACAVAIWEMMEYGKMPWRTSTNNATLKAIVKGKRLPQPKIATKDFWEILLCCWLHPEQRPNFYQFKTMIENIKDKHKPEHPGRKLGDLATSGKKGRGTEDKYKFPDEEEASEEDLAVQASALSSYSKTEDTADAADAYGHSGLQSGVDKKDLQTINAMATTGGDIGITQQGKGKGKGSALA